MPKLDGEVSSQISEAFKANGSFSFFRCIQPQESQIKTKSTTQNEENVTVNKVNSTTSTNGFVSKRNKENSVSSQSKNENSRKTHRRRSAKTKRNIETSLKTKQTSKESFQSTSEQDVAPSLLTNGEKRNETSKQSTQLNSSRLSTSIDANEKKTSTSLKTDHRRSDSYKRAQNRPRGLNHDDSHSSNDESNDESVILSVKDTTPPVQKEKLLEKPTTLPIQKSSKTENKTFQLSPAEQYGLSRTAMLQEAFQRPSFNKSVSEDTGRKSFQQTPKGSPAVSPAYSEPTQTVSSPTESSCGPNGSGRQTHFSFYPRTDELMRSWHRTQARKIHKKSRFSYSYGPVYQPTLFERAIEMARNNPEFFSPNRPIQSSKQSS